MKLKHTLFALLGLMGTACSNQELIEGSAGTGQVQVTASIVKSRVSFNEADSITNAYWQNGDTITLNTPTQGNLNYIATVSEDIPTMASFAPEFGSLKDIDGETVYACYPSSTITDGVVTLPVTNVWTDENPFPFAYAVSRIAESNVNLFFDHTFSFLKLTLSSLPLQDATSTDGEKTVHRLSIKLASGSLGVVSGTFNFKDQSVNITEGSNEIVCTLSKAFNPSEETERSVYVPILPQEGNVAITISLIHDYEGGEDILLEMEKQTPADGLVKGCVYKLSVTGNSSAVIEGDSGEIHLAVAGTLSDYITDENKYTIKSLKLSGYLNGDDIRLLREMSTGEGILTDLDVTDVVIVKGGGSYYSLSYYTQNDIWGEYFFTETKLVTVVLPKSIVSIDASAFKSCSALETVTIPTGSVLSTISHSAFKECSVLKSISIPVDVPLTHIGESAFGYCSSLKSFVIPDAVTTMEGYVFNDCKSLSNVTIGKNLSSIGNYAFASCETLTTVTIPEDAALTTIEDGAFRSSGIRTITLPIGLKTIGEMAFDSCESLTQIEIPDSVTTIGNHAFSGCDALARVTMGTKVTSLGNGTFYDCSTLVSINLSEGITAIEAYTFKNCSALKSIVIPDAVTKISSGAFLSCYALESATIGKGVTSIGYQAFANCEVLKAIAIPDATTSIGEGAFEQCI